MKEPESKRITDQQYESVLPKKDNNPLHKIGNKKQAIQELRSLDWDKYGFDEFVNKIVNSEDGLKIVRIGNTYYWSDK